MSATTLLAEDFARFWQTFPHRVGKLAAQRAYVKARQHASAAELLDGIARYVQAKPAWAEYCHPATWLNSGRWMDEAPAPTTRIYEPWVCPHEPQCKHRPACDFLSTRRRA